MKSVLWGQLPASTEPPTAPHPHSGILISRSNTAIKATRRLKKSAMPGALILRQPFHKTLSRKVSPLVTSYNNNDVYLSCAHQRPERSHDMY